MESHNNINVLAVGICRAWAPLEVRHGPSVIAGHSAIRLPSAKATAQPDQVPAPVKIANVCAHGRYYTTW